MNILAINSSKKQAEISLFDGNNFYTHFMDATKSHSEFLLKEIEDFLMEHDLTIQQIDCVSVNVGPGSFTGIRIGISFVKAFICALNLNAVKVNNFEIIQHNIQNKENSYYIVLSSNNEDFYTLKVDNNNYCYGFMNKQQLNDIILKTHEKVYCAESELLNFSDILNINAVSIKENTFIEISKQKIKAKQYLNINDISPLYIKKSQAEIGLFEKVKQNLIIKSETTLDELALLEAKCFENPYSVNLLKEDLINSNRHQFFAYFKNELVGYISFEETFDELNLFKICVLPEFREYGIASRLMKNMIDYFNENENINKIFLEVDAQNTNAIKLYEKFDFQKISIRKNYYQNGDDALIFEKKKK